MKLRKTLVLVGAIHIGENKQWQEADIKCLHYLNYLNPTFSTAQDGLQIHFFIILCGARGNNQRGTKWTTYIG